VLVLLQVGPFCDGRSELRGWEVRRGKAVVAMLTSQVVVPWLLSGVEVGVVVTIVVQPPLHYLPLAPAVTGAANAASTLPNLFFTGTNPPPLNASNPPTFCYH